MVGERATLDVQVDDALFRASGRVILFAGYQAVYRKVDNKRDENRELPAVKAQQALSVAFFDLDGLP